ncbi:MAG: glycosyltransferase [Nitrospira sp.]|nr:glycosyltransferase [Nitrospira sp.]MCP9462239.1 glycosyltransferase [Nitrospira sp.]MCP9474742.1 glycosyltransferase [Nitrospira sp.]
MDLSIIIPAYNEERLIERCLASVFASLARCGKPDLASEVLVVDNNSTDRTARLAKEAGARVVFEPINQIGRARNAGAAVATGDWLLFLDADSLMSPELLADILMTIERNTCVGLGSTLLMKDLPWWAKGIFHFWRSMSIVCRWAAGALFVCRRDAFFDVGGFPEDVYALEEIELSRRLKQWGRRRNLQFVILTAHPLETSPRKVTLYSKTEIARQILRIFFRRGRTLRDKRLLSVWYDGRR